MSDASINALKEAVNHLVDKIDSVSINVGAMKTELEESSNLLQMVSASSSNPAFEQMAGALQGMIQAVDEVVELADAFQESGKQYVARL